MYEPLRLNEGLSIDDGFKVSCGMIWVSFRNEGTLPISPACSSNLSGIVCRAERGEREWVQLYAWQPVNISLQSSLDTYIYPSVLFGIHSSVTSTRMMKLVKPVTRGLCGKGKVCGSWECVSMTCEKQGTYHNCLNPFSPFFNLAQVPHKGWEPPFQQFHRWRKLSAWLIIWWN